MGITPREHFACLARVRRQTRPWTAANFGQVEWMPDGSIDPALSELLPRGAREMTACDMATLEKWFRSRGKFPAVKMNTGELGIAARIAALETEKVADITYGSLLSILHALGLDLRLSPYNRQRPTLEDLQRENGDSCR